MTGRRAGVPLARGAGMSDSSPPRPTPPRRARNGGSPHVHYDALVVGGGPAGLSAAIWLGRYLHTVALVDSGDPRNWETRGVNGYLGQPDVKPAELRRSGREECRRYGVELVDAEVERAVKHDDDHFELRLHDGASLHGRRLLVAIGIKDVWPDVPGLGRVYGDRAHVCPDCDGHEASGKKTVVIGSGRKAVGMALSLTTWTRELTVCTNGADPDYDDELADKLDRLGIPTITDPITRIRFRNGDMRSLEFAGREPFGCEKIFFAIAQYPADDLGVQLGCQRDEDRQIVVDAAQHTSVRNVFAAGDITPGPQLAVRAASEGAVAALAIHRSLVPPERKL